MEEKYRALIQRIQCLYQKFTNQPWVLGLSGGVDSVVLFHVLREVLAQESLHVVHINHNYRGTDSMEDEKFVRELCHHYGVKLTVKQIDMEGYAKEEKISLEMSGREQRYRYFHEIMGDDGILALAHHQDDQVETILMRILRGTGLHGLTGMTMIDQRYVRPLLDWKKTELYELAKEKGWNYREDYTNYIPDVLRNKIRLELLPLLRNDYQSGVDEALLRLSHIAKANDDYWHEYKEKFMISQVVRKRNCLYFPRQRFLCRSTMEQSEMIRACYEELQGHVMDLGYEHIQLVMQEIKTFKNALGLDMPGGIRVYINSKRVYFYKKKAFQKNCQEIFLSESKLTPWGRFILERRAPLDGEKPNHDKQIFDLDKIASLKLRMRMPGDLFYPWGMEGTKKIKDFFIDEKIPPFLRDHIPLLVSGEDIVWVVGYRPDRRFLYDGVKGSPLIITYEEEHHGLSL